MVAADQAHIEGILPKGSAWRVVPFWQDTLDMDVSHYWYIYTYRQASNTSGTKSLNLNISRVVLQLSLPNPLKPGFK